MNRIVAIIDREVITQRDVDLRTTGGQSRAVVLEALVESALLAGEAERQRVTVEPGEIDTALAEIARSNNLTVAQILAEAAKQGFDEASYRAELRRQLIEMRVVNGYIADVLTRGGAAPSDGPAGARKRLLAELRAYAFVEVRP